MKKKEIIIIVCILILGIIIISVIAINKRKKAEEQYNNTIQTENTEVEQEQDYSQTSLSNVEQYKKIKIDDIIRVEIESYTKTQYLTKKITDKEEIKDVYKKIGMIELKNTTDTRTSDDDLTVRFVINENEKIPFFFEKENIVIGNAQYQTEGLTRIKMLLK